MPLLLHQAKEAREVGALQASQQQRLQELEAEVARQHADDQEHLERDHEEALNSLREEKEDLERQLREHVCMGWGLTDRDAVSGYMDIRIYDTGRLIGHIE